MVFDIHTSDEWVEAFDLYRRVSLVVGDGQEAADQLNRFFASGCEAMAAGTIGQARTITKDDRANFNLYIRFPGAVSLRSAHAPYVVDYSSSVYFNRREVESRWPELRDNEPVTSKGTAGRKPQYDWGRFQSRAITMFWNDDLNAESELNISKYAQALIDWSLKKYGENKTPDLRTLRRKVPEWFQNYLNGL